jgi:hypothetical protein
LLQRAIRITRFHEHIAEVESRTCMGWSQLKYPLENVDCLLEAIHHVHCIASVIHSIDMQWVVLQCLLKLACRILNEHCILSGLPLDHVPHIIESTRLHGGAWIQQSVTVASNGILQQACTVEHVPEVIVGFGQVWFQCNHMPVLRDGLVDSLLCMQLHRIVVRLVRWQVMLLHDNLLLRCHLKEQQPPAHDHVKGSKRWLVTRRTERANGYEAPIRRLTNDEFGMPRPS